MTLVRSLLLLPAILALAPYPISAAEPPAVRKDFYGDPLPTGAMARMGTMRFRLNGKAFAFAPDEKSFALSDNREGVTIWDISTGLPIRRMKETTDWIRSLTFCDKGTKLIASMGRTLTVWDVRSGRILTQTQEPLGESKSEVDEPFVFSANGQRIAVICSPNHLRIGEPFGRILSDIKTPTMLGDSLAFSPDNSRLAGYSEDGLHVWDVATGKALDSLKMPYPPRRQPPVFSPDGRDLYFLSQPQLLAERSDLYHWIPGSGRKPVSIVRGELLYLGPITADGRMLPLFTRKGIRFWDLPKRKMGAVLPRSDDGPTSLVVSPQGTYLAGVCPARHFARIWQVRDGLEVGSPHPSHETRVWQLAFSPDGELLASSADYCVKLWHTATGKPHPANVVHLGECNLLKFSPDGHLLTSPGPWESERFVDITNASTGQCIKRLKGDHLLEHSADGRLTLTFETAKTARVVLRRQDQAKPLVTLEGKVPVACLGFLGDGSQFYVAWTREQERSSYRSGDLFEVYDTNTRVRLGKWVMAENGAELETFVGPTPDGRFLVGFVGLKTVFFNPRDGSVATQFPLKELPVEGIGRFTFYGSGWYPRERVFSPDTAIMAVRDDPWIRLVELSSGSEVQTVRVSHEAVSSLTFSPDGKRLATGTDDGEILLWNLYALDGPPPALAAADLPRCWDDLLSTDGPTAWRAICRLVNDLDKAVDLLGRRIVPAPLLDRVAVRRLIAQLDARKFTDREDAVRELTRLGYLAEDDLRQALKSKPSPEARRRTDALLAQLDPLRANGETLRSLRAIHVLERVGTKEARSVLEKIAAGEPTTRETMQASGALKRLERLAKAK